MSNPIPPDMNIHALWARHMKWQIILKKVLDVNRTMVSWK